MHEYIALYKYIECRLVRCCVFKSLMEKHRFEK